MGNVPQNMLNCLLITTLICVNACVPAKRQLPDTLVEVSGAVRLADSLVMLNDGGNSPSLHYLKLERSPKSTSKITLTPAGDETLQLINTDWESLAIYPNGTLCVCDIGDNRAQRVEVKFHLLRAGEVKTISRKYPDGPQNAEACFVSNNELYVLSKAVTGRSPRAKLSRVYRVDTNELQVPVMQLTDSFSLKGRVITGITNPGGNGQLTGIAYNYGLLGGLLPWTRTSLFKVAFNRGQIDRGSLRYQRVRSPFTPTQYEAIVALPTHEGKGAFLIFSERTLWIPPRWRKVVRSR